MDIAITLNKRLEKALKADGEDPTQYMPAYGGESVGLDLYYAGDVPLYIMDDKMIRGDAPGKIEKVLIPTGLRIALPKGYVALIKDRGSISKTNLTRRAGVIDPGYTGEIFVNVMGEAVILPGAKLPVQLVVVKAETNYTILSNESFENLTSGAQRGEGKTGSSD